LKAVFFFFFAHVHPPESSTAVRVPFPLLGAWTFSFLFFFFSLLGWRDAGKSDSPFVPPPRVPLKGPFVFHPRCHLLFFRPQFLFAPSVVPVLPPSASSRKKTKQPFPMRGSVFFLLCQSRGRPTSTFLFRPPMSFFWPTPTVLTLVVKTPFSPLQGGIPLKKLKFPYYSFLGPPSQCFLLFDSQFSSLSLPPLSSRKKWSPFVSRVI